MYTSYNPDHQSNTVILYYREVCQGYFYFKNGMWSWRVLSEDHDSTAVFNKILQSFVATEKYTRHSEHGVKFVASSTLKKFQVILLLYACVINLKFF